MGKQEELLWTAQKDFITTYKQLRIAAGVTKETEYRRDRRINAVFRAIAYVSADIFFIRINSIRDGHPILPLHWYSDERQYDKLKDDEFSRLVSACSEVGLTEYTMRLLRDRKERDKGKTQTATGGKLWL